MQNEFKGFSLFNDVEDTTLRARNRAVVLANIAEDHKTAEQRISAKGSALILGYFTQIPQDERKEVTVDFAAEMTKRGFAIA